MAKRGAYAKGIAKRDEILTVALDLVAANGFRRTSVKDLADAVGLTQAGLLHYFDSKDELWVEVLRRRDAIDRSAGFDGKDLLDAFVRIVRHNAEVPGLVQLFVNLSAAAATDAEHPAHAYFRQRYDDTRAALRESIVRMQADGRLRDDVDAERLASVLIAVSDGMQIQWLYDDHRAMDEHLALAVDLALRSGV